MKYIQPLLIAVMVIYIFFLRECTKTVICPEMVQDTVTVTKWDTVIITKTFQKPEPDVITDCIFIYENIDTAVILADYYKQKIYNRHLDFDSIGYLDITDTVFKNSLQGYNYKSYFKVPTKTIYINTVLPIKNKIYLSVGAEINYSLNNSITISPAAILTTRKNNKYTASYDPFLKIASVGAYYNLKR